MNALSSPEPLPDDNVREIPKWTRRYAQNRTVPVLVFLTVSVLLFLAMGGSSLLFGWALFRSHGPFAIVGSTVLVILCVAAIIYMSVPRWGGELIERTSQRFYGSEGKVALSPLGEIRRRSHMPVILAGVLFGVCIIVEVALGMAGYVPEKYMQPVSALYMVPFLAFLFLWSRPVIGPISLLWPALYALHAILITADVPILFHRPWDILNMLIPVAGYGLLAGTVGHFYNRHALKKLKGLAMTPPEPGLPEEEIHQ